MRGYFTSLIVTVVIVAVVVIAWAPTAKSGSSFPEESCDDFCQTQTICMCAKLLGGSLRLTQCVIAPSCVCGNYGPVCDCSSATPVCKLWEKGLVAQELPFETQQCEITCQ